MNSGTRRSNGPLTESDTAVDDGYSSSSRPDTPQVNYDVIMNVIEALLKAYASLDYIQLVALLAPTFRHEVLPQSLGIPSRNLAAFAEHAAGIFGIFDKFSMEPTRDPLISYCHGTPVVIIHAKMDGVLKDNKGPWVNECVLIIMLTADGTRIEEIREFVDSAKALVMARKHGRDVVGTNEHLDTLVYRGNMTAVSFGWLLLGIMASGIIGARAALLAFWLHPILGILLESAVKSTPFCRYVVGGVLASKTAAKNVWLNGSNQPDGN